MYSWDNAQVVLVGNKCDLEQDRAVTQERGQRLADQLGNVFERFSSTLDVRFCCLFFRPTLFAWLNCNVLCVFKGFTDKNTFMGENSNDARW